MRTAVSHIIQAIILLIISAESQVVISGKSIVQSGGLTKPAAFIWLIIKKDVTRNENK